MGTFHKEIQLFNYNDLLAARKHEMGEEDIRSITVAALVDTGALYCCINEHIQAYLQCPVIEQIRCQLAHGISLTYDLVGPVEIRCQGQVSLTRALVLPGNAEPLLGAIPLEDMRLLVDPAQQQLFPDPNAVRV
ncbi:MAG: hypothetical protein P0Y53_06145 [Candidatus Pseudobacter hemicellulosilyticus]|uniref:Clan AA aspartic protease n=1 Tax=Candidatus Pseudobacter hemicellulosilyticus TaxID=3121375 RepID=A0AAJ5WRX1_9BACT|nr:MAG: hypothetical protein P0Y53_06145 [Pseudobacter sp.]